MTWVDWTRPIEAVHEDGRVEPMVFDGFGSDGMPETQASPSDGQSNRYWWGNGRDRCNSRWRIRNTPAPEPAQCTDIGTVAPALVERMKNLVHSAQTVPGPIGDEARAIVAELPAEVDGDLVEARRIVLAEDIQRTGSQQSSILEGRAGQRKVALVLEGMAYARRQLEREGRE